MKYTYSGFGAEFTGLPLCVIGDIDVDGFVAQLNGPGEYESILRQSAQNIVDAGYSVSEINKLLANQVIGMNTPSGPITVPYQTIAECRLINGARKYLWPGDFIPSNVMSLWTLVSSLNTKFVIFTFVGSSPEIINLVSLNSFGLQPLTFVGEVDYPQVSFLSASIVKSTMKATVSAAGSDCDRWRLISETPSYYTMPVEIAEIGSGSATPNVIVPVEFTAAYGVQYRFMFGDGVNWTPLGNGIFYFIEESTDTSVPSPGPIVIGKDGTIVSGGSNITTPVSNINQEAKKKWLDGSVGPWAFNKQKNKWGYLNNPRWHNPGTSIDE